MTAESILVIVAASSVVLLFVGLLFIKTPKRVKHSKYVKKWRDIQKLCGDKQEWAHAIIHADMLLDEVLKKKRVPGKTMGERMVNVQKKLKSNDSLWKAHKLASLIRKDESVNLKENEVKNALVAFRQGLKDLGALK